MGKMENKVVPITGGGKGIGFGIATTFAKEGANLVITGRTVSRLEDTQKTLEACGVSVLPVAADGGHEDDVKAAVRAAVDQFGKIDVLINNAQISASGVRRAV